MPSHHRIPKADAPTARQQAYIRQLAMRRGISFTPPKTKAEASRLIDQLRRRQDDSPADRRRELKQVRAALARSGDGAAVRDDEVEGYGSTATWKGGEA
jgi:hypothetical protein